MIIDLTHTISEKTPVWPGDTAIVLTPRGNPEAGVLNHQLTCSMHVGTHMDGPRHMLPTGKFLHEFDVEKFHGRGVIIDCRAKMTIDADMLNSVPLQKGDIVLLYSGLSEVFEAPSYFETFPMLTKECAEALVKAGVSMVGLDFGSPDKPPFEIHRILLAGEVLIIENLTNLKALNEALKSQNTTDFSVTALPLKTAADSAPVRVIATL